jgi:hypothetical protein
MTSEYNKRRTLVDIDLPIWGRVKYFATIKKLCLNDAVQLLLRIGLNNYGYAISQQQQIMVPSGESLSASTQNAPSFEIQ